MSLVVILGLFTSCDPLYYLTVQNNSDYPVVIVSQKFDGLEATYNPNYSRHTGSSAQVAFPGEWVDIYSWGRWDAMCSKQDSGYIKIFILDTLTFMDTIQIYYMEEWSVKQSRSKISFPPTESMSKFRMWPPYGTYDSLGHPNN